MNKRWIPYILIGCSIVFIIVSTVLETLILLFIGIALVIGSVLLTIFVESITIFIKDKELDIEQLRKQGLTIVTCNHCQKENVLEDQYCIYCHEPLGEDDDV